MGINPNISQDVSEFILNILNVYKRFYKKTITNGIESLIYDIYMNFVFLLIQKNQTICKWFKKIEIFKKFQLKL